MSRTRRRPRTRAAKKDPAIGRTVDVVIDDIGAGGDGIGLSEETPVFVPLALPGDVLSVRLTGRRGQGYAAETVESRSIMPRSQPICPHFGACGGCRLQHVPPLDYRTWKRQRVEMALQSQGIQSVPVRPLIDGDPAARRRLRLAFERAGENLELGFRRRSGRQIVPIETCPIALPAIVRLFDPLRRCLLGLDLAASGGEAMITAAKNGLDLLLESPVEPGLSDREALAALADAEDLARLAWRPDAHTPPEPIAARRQPTLDFGDISVTLPAGAFLQATEAAERAIREAIVEAIGDARSVADFFSGCGALGLPLAGDASRISAFERDPSMIQALTAAARASGLVSRVDAAVRDLEREPLSGDELQQFDALILDPPRAGARTQIERIAAAASPKSVAMVSCNPATFARDARILIDAGYRLDWVQPIDAFLYSAEIELVGAFERASPLDS